MIFHPKHVLFSLKNLKNELQKRRVVHQSNNNNNNNNNNNDTNDYDIMKLLSFRRKWSNKVKEYYKGTTLRFVNLFFTLVHLQSVSIFSIFSLPASFMVYCCLFFVPLSN